MTNEAWLDEISKYVVDHFDPSFEIFYSITDLKQFLDGDEIEYIHFENDDRIVNSGISSNSPLEDEDVRDRLYKQLNKFLQGN